MQPAIKGLERECWGATDGIQNSTGPEQHDSNFISNLASGKFKTESTSRMVTSVLCNSSWLN